MSLGISNTKYHKIVKNIDEFKKNDNSEFEVRFLGRNFKFANLDVDKFKKVLNYFIASKDKGGLGLNYKKNVLLDIRDEIDENKRLSIIGLDNIKKYWLNEKIDDLDHKFITKENISKVDLNEYGLRFSLCNENLMDNDNEDKIYLMNKNKTSKKTYRLKNRYEVYTNDKMMRLDFTCVKQSISSSSTFQKSKTINNNIVYEIELELLHNSEMNKIDNEVIFKKILQNCYLILSLIQNNNVILSISEKNKILENYSKLVGNNNNNKSKFNFIAANPVTLHLKNLEKSNRYNNILNSYAVTLKADGERRLLYINKDNSVYLIDINFNITNLNYKIPEWSDTIIECELISDKNLLLMYDILFLKGKDIRRSQLRVEQSKRSSKNMGRLYYLDLFLKTINKLYNDKKIEEMNLIKIQNKKYLFSSGYSNSIFEKAREMWKSRKDKIYYCDGLIFIPIKEHYPLKSGAWYSLFKWKPPELNTIDFLIKVIKDKKGKEEINSILLDKKLIDGSYETKLIQYKTLQLYVGGKKKSYNKNDLVPVLFNPFNSNDNKYNRCNLIIDAENKIYAINPLNNKKEEIKDNTIVEFGYDDSKDENFKWIPHKVRNDKTQSYKSGEKVFGNYIRTAKDIFKSIIVPVTENIITTGNIPSELKNKSLNLNEDNNENNNYYNNINKNFNYKDRLSYQNFHNLYIKEYLLQSVAPSILNGSNKISGKLIDFGSGKGGDITKWKRAKLAEVIGIEYDIKNIEYAKKLFRKIPRPKPKVYYCRGDLSKLLFPNQDAGLTESNKINLKKFLPIKNTFDIVSIQFAIHYFFKNEIILRTILQNITDNLKIGGFLIGTCFNGKKLFNKLKGKKKIEGKTVNDELLWSITKKYKSRTFPDTKTSLGKEIEVYVKSIGKDHSEYLVNFEYLEKLLSEYGFTLVKLKSFEESYDEMLDGKFKNNVINIDKIKNEITESEKEFSFLNSSFIFKKIKNTPDSVYAKLLKLMKKEETKKYKEKASKEVNNTINKLDVSVVNNETEELIEEEETGMNIESDVESDVGEIGLNTKEI